MAIFVFRRDFRLEDNAGLNAALDKEDVLCVFVFDSRQQEESNEYFSVNGFQYLVESLIELDRSLRSFGAKLNVYSGLSHEILKYLSSKYGDVYFNEDYTPFSKLRDDKIIKSVEEQGNKVHVFNDALLNPPGGVLKSDGGFYSVFTPYYRAASLVDVKKPKTSKFRFIVDNNSLDISSINYGKNKDLAVVPGRDAAIKVLEDLHSFKDYKSERDFPILSKTTMLSAANKFGVISPREFYFKASSVLGKDHELVRQLYWRDFFYQLAYHNPYVFGNSFNSKYDKVVWDDNPKFFDAWKEGKTGFPIVDAGMRELNLTGYMHNRVRMIVASFLTKDLHIDWRLGEKYFANKLVDYDPCVNNGSWQWAASTGADAQPYFRIFNPWRQQERFDENCEYIKKWIPELRDFSSKTIHNLDSQRPLGISYPKPIIDHKKESEIAKERFKFL